MVKKCLWTLNVNNNYAPEITHFTYPWLKRYAGKCGAEFRIISERKYPQWPAVYEKLQLFELGREYDWNIYIDSDALVHPDFVDMTEQLPRNTICHYGADLRPNRFVGDEYFWRDGRNIGSCNWFTIASNWCLDLWNPDGDRMFAEANIWPTTNERAFGMEPSHLIDDYILSRNIARYGLKVTTVMDWFKSIGHPDEHYLFHEYCSTKEKKVEQIIKQMYIWGMWKEAGLPEPQQKPKEQEIPLPPCGHFGHPATSHNCV